MKTLTTLAVLLIATAANADLISVNAALMQSGMNASNSLPGAIIQRIDQHGGTTYDPNVQDVIVVDSLRGSEPTSFGSYDVDYRGLTDCYLGDGAACLGALFAGFQVTFDQPTDFVEVRSVHALGIEPVIYAYGSGGSLIAECGPFGGCSTSLGLATASYAGIQDVETRTAIAAAGITRIAWGGFSGGAWAQEVTYSTPEPSLLALWSLGLLITAAGLRQFKR